MNGEPRNIEFKLSWHDGCRKWICGFATAHPGRSTPSRNHFHAQG